MQPAASRGLVDLHLHTTASDGRCEPAELVDRAAAAGVTTLAATDHDTTAAVAEVRARASDRGIDCVTGIEITAVEDGRDVHVLGYFFDPGDAALGRFLARQRSSRIERAEAIAARLAALAMPIDLEPVLEEARRNPARSIGRPQVARAMIAAGHVADVNEAFVRWLGAGARAFMPRPGASVAEVIEIVHDAGGLVSLAHPGRTRLDGRIPAMRDAGLDALEVYHTDHDEAARTRYRDLAAQLDLLISGGSDYHGDPAREFEPGAASLPIGDWQRLGEARHRYAR